MTTRCNECGHLIDDTQAVLFDDAWCCMDCHSKLSKVRDDKWYREILIGLKNKLKEDLRRKK